MTDHMTQLTWEDAIPDEPAPPELLAPDPLVVRLHKAFFWYQSASRWPYYLSRAEPGRAYTKAEIAEDVFGEDQRHRSKSEAGWLRYIYGISVSREYQEVALGGIGLFEPFTESNDRYIVTADGIQLGKMYSENRHDDAWIGVFASILARNDVRVRSVLLHLSMWHCALRFTDGSSRDVFFPSGRGAFLRYPDGSEYQLFEYHKGESPAYNFTQILNRDPYAALGPFLRANIERRGLKVPQNIKFEGGRQRLQVVEEPSANELRDYMKQALALFRDIGALVYVEHRQGWTLSRERCAAVFEPALVADLFGAESDERFLNALQSAYLKLSDGDGFVRVTDIRDYIADELDIPPGERVGWFNGQVAYYLRPDVGKLHIVGVFHAQAAPDECLFGNLEMEYVRFSFAR